MNTQKIFSAGFCKGKKARGQAAIEFIFIILIVVVYIFTASLPLIENAKGSVEDIDIVTKTNFESQRVVNSINKISLLGVGSKETLQVLVPSNSEIICSADKISFQSEINITGNNPQTSACPDNLCTKDLDLREGISLSCGFATLTKGIYDVVIEKQDTAIFVGVNN